MKRVFLVLALLPLMIMAQEAPESVVIENVMLTPHPTKVAEFETGIAAHNQKYHTTGAFQSQVYWISSGKNSGKYIWSMGPLPWSAMDNRPTEDNGHDADWNTNVAPYTLAEGETHYWKFHPKFSNMSKDFSLKNISVFMLDIKRFKNPQAIEVIKKVQKVYLEKRPDHMYGVYTNELANTDGLDMAWVDFFDKMAWLGEEDNFPQEYEEVHGEGSFESFLVEVEQAFEGEYEELWIFRKDLSGSKGEVKAVAQQ